MALEFNKQFMRAYLVRVTSVESDNRGQQTKKMRMVALAQALTLATLVSEGSGVGALSLELKPTVPHAPPARRPDEHRDVGVPSCRPPAGDATM